MKEVSSENVPRVFKAGRFWSSNVFAATLAGGLGGLLMLVVMVIVVSGNPTANNIWFASGLALVLVLSVVCLVPGNLIAAYPYVVSVEGGRGLELRTPIKTVYIPIKDVLDVEKSYLQPGYVVHLKHRRGLLGSFLIPRYFGDQAEPLANAIREELHSHVKVGLP
jgi:hypothetical protein